MKHYRLYYSFTKANAVAFTKQRESSQHDFQAASDAEARATVKVLLETLCDRLKDGLAWRESPRADKLIELQERNVSLDTTLGSERVPLND